jgi:hypothetical protein
MKALNVISTSFVIPAKAGIPGQEDTALLHEIPAFAGMTGF